MSKLLGVAAKTWKEFTRNRRGMLLTLGLPLVFMLIFGFAFGGENGTPTYELALVNEDAAGEGGHGARLAGILRGLEYESGQAIFDVRDVASRAEGVALVEDRDAAALVVVPQNFSRALAGAGARADDGVVQVLGDPSYAAYNMAAGIVEGVVAEYNARAGGQSAPRVSVQTQSILSAKLEAFDFIAPGLMVFAILNMAPQVSAVLAREKEQRTLDRLRLTRMRSIDLLGGVSLTQMAIAVISLSLMLATALLMGLHIQGNVAVVFLVALVGAVAVMGVGMIIASFANRQDDAANLGILFSVPASFLSGAFFPIPVVGLFSVGDRLIQVYDILPSTHAVRALRSVLTLGNGIEDVLFELGALVVLTALFFAVGAWLYRARRLDA